MTRICHWLALVPLFCASGAYATLGENEDSIQQNQIELGMGHIPPTHQASLAAPYTVHVLRGPMHSVKQYVNAAGIVFAMTWRGVTHPDLAALLGSHFAEYHRLKSLRVRPPGRSRLHIVSEQIVVRRGGHMRDFRGRAYLPGQVPANVDAEALP